MVARGGLGGEYGLYRAVGRTGICFKDLLGLRRVSMLCFRGCVGCSKSFTEDSKDGDGKGSSRVVICSSVEMVVLAVE